MKNKSTDEFSSNLSNNAEQNGDLSKTHNEEIFSDQENNDVSAEPGKKRLKIIIKVFIGIIGIVYLLVLLKMILFKFGTDPLYRGINILPFQFIKDYTENGASISTLLKNVVGNFAIFIPAGIILPSLIKKMTIKSSVLAVFCISLSFEIIQFIFSLGISDIDDLILNTAGGFVGVLIFFLIIKRLKNELKIDIASLIILCLFGVSSLGGLYFLGYGQGIIPAQIESVNGELVQSIENIQPDISGENMSINGNVLSLDQELYEDEVNESDNGNMNEGENKPKLVSKSVEISADTKLISKEIKADYAPTGNVKKTTATYNQLSLDEVEQFLQEKKYAYVDIWTGEGGAADYVVFTYWNDENLKN